MSGILDKQDAVAPSMNAPTTITPSTITPSMIDLAKASRTAHGQLAALRGARLWLDAHDEANIGRQT